MTNKQTIEKIKELIQNEGKFHWSRVAEAILSVLGWAIILVIFNKLGLFK